MSVVRQLQSSVRMLGALVLLEVNLLMLVVLLVVPPSVDPSLLLCKVRYPNLTWPNTAPQ